MASNDTFYGYLRWCGERDQRVGGAGHDVSVGEGFPQQEWCHQWLSSLVLLSDSGSSSFLCGSGFSYVVVGTGFVRERDLEVRGFRVDHM